MDFKKDLIVNVENAESQRRAEIRRRREAERYFAEQQRRQLDEEFARRRAEREHELRIKVAAEGRLRRMKEACLMDQRAQDRANTAFLFFAFEREQLFKRIDDTLRPAIMDHMNQDQRAELFLVSWYQSKGYDVSTITDISRLKEGWSLLELKDDLEDEMGLDPLACKYFSAMVAPYLLARPRRAVDDLKELMRAMHRSYS